TPSALSRPLARMVSSAQLTVPNFSTPIVTLLAAFAGCASAKLAHATNSTANRPDRNDRSSTVLCSHPLCVGASQATRARELCRRLWGKRDRGTLASHERA